MIGGFTTTITILKPLMSKGDYGSESQPDWTLPPTRVTVEFPVSVQPMTSSEGSPERPTVVTGWQLIGPRGRDLPLGSQDRVEVASGAVYSVKGDVLRFPHARRLNAVDHVEAMLELRTG